MIADDRSPAITASTRTSLTSSTTTSPCAGDGDRNEADQDGRHPPERDVAHDDATQPHKDATAEAAVLDVDKKLLLLQLIECLNKLAKTSDVEPDRADDVDEVAQSSDDAQTTSEQSESLEPADDEPTAGDESRTRGRRESKRRLPAVVDDDDDEAETETDRVGCPKRRCTESCCCPATGGGYRDRMNPSMTSRNRESRRSLGRRAMRWDEHSEVYTISSESSDEDRDYERRRRRRRRRREKDAEKDLTFLLKAFGWPLTGIDLEVFRSTVRNFVSVYESNKNMIPADECTMTSYEKRVVRIVRRLLPEVTSHEAASVLVLLLDKPATDHNPRPPPASNGRPSSSSNAEATDGELARPRSHDGGDAYDPWHCTPGTGSATPPPPPQRQSPDPTPRLPQKPPVVESQTSKPAIPSLLKMHVEPPQRAFQEKAAPYGGYGQTFSGAPHRPAGGLLPGPCEAQLNESVLRSAMMQSIIRAQSLPNKRTGAHSD